MPTEIAYAKINLALHVTRRREDGYHDLESLVVFADVADELRLMRGMAPALTKRPQPLTIALADTHPGNFIVDADGVAWFVDLEKVHIGSPAIDLAHAILPTSTLWHPDVGQTLTLTLGNGTVNPSATKGTRPVSQVINPTASAAMAIAKPCTRLSRSPSSAQPRKMLNNGVM